MNFDDYQSLISNYKNKISSRYKSVSLDYIERITPQEKYLVSTKYDGHFYGIIYRENQVTITNPKGKIIEGLRINTIISDVLKEKVESVCLVGELYLPINSRSRSFNINKGIVEKSDQFKFAVFDILAVNEELTNYEDVFECYAAIQKMITNDVFHPVEAEEVTSRKHVKALFNKAIENKKEGVVIKGLEETTYKLKPLYTFDAVVVGFAEGDGHRAGMVRDLLLAFMKTDGSYQIFAHLSHGFNDAERKDLLLELTPKVVNSSYLEIAANKVAFRMIEPTIVVEFTCLDVLGEDSRGTITKANLDYNTDSGYELNWHQQSVSTIIPNFLRFRDDKEPNIQDTRFSQVEEVISFEKEDTDIAQKREKSEIIQRKVYIKESKKGKMVRKFILIKTNKETLDSHPAFVFHLTDFSAGRKDPLKREIRVSNSKEQIENIFHESIASNIKKGWEEV